MRLSRTPEIARIFRDCGFCWIFLDLEHGALDFDAIGQIAGVGEAELLQRYSKLGFTLALAGTDLTLLVAGARAKIGALETR